MHGVGDPNVDPDPHPPENTAVDNMPPKKRQARDLSASELTQQQLKKRQLAEQNAGVKEPEASDSESEDQQEFKAPAEKKESKEALPDHEPGSDLERQQKIGVWTVHSVLGHTAPIPCSSDNP